MEQKATCPHCGEPLVSAEANDGRCPSCGEPVCESLGRVDMDEACRTHSRRREPRGLSVGPFLIALGILLLAVSFLCKMCGFEDRFQVTVVTGRAGLLSLVVGLFYGSICTWLTLRRRGARGLWALSTLVLLLCSCATMAITVFSPSLSRYGARACGSSCCCQPSLKALGNMDKIHLSAYNIFESLYELEKDIPGTIVLPPEGHPDEAPLDYLYGSMGQLPEFSDEARESWGTHSENLHFLLATNGRTEPRFRYKVDGWDGPYLRRELGEDPWGYAYIVSVGGIKGGAKPGSELWCLSAGPNHIVETPAYATEVRGDDLGRRVSEMAYHSSGWTCGPGGCGPR